MIRLMVRLVLAAWVVAALPSRGLAQGFDAQRFVPAAGANSALAVQRPQVLPDLVWGAGMFVHFADDPMPVRRALTFDVIGSLGLKDRFELAVQLPIHAYYVDEPANEGVGDLRLTPIAVLWQGGGEVALSLGASLPLSIPAGAQSELRSDGGASVEPRLLFGALAPGWGAYASVGFRVRPQAQDPDPIGHELTFGAGGRYGLAGDGVLDAIVEIVGASDLSIKDDHDTALELWGALGWKASPDVTIFAGGGPGLTDGFGTPDWRVLMGVRWAPAGGRRTMADVDGDRVPDDHDECPDVPEPAGDDGDGCPDKARIVLQEGKIFIIGKIHFDTGSAALLPKSNQLLDEIASAFNDHIEIKVIEIQGHADDVGGVGLNDRLSRARAESVRKALTDRGVAAERLTAVGFGKRRPIDTSTSPAGRARNRRVEFIVKERAP